MTSGLVNYHKIKAPDSRDQEVLELLKKPGVEEKIQAIAATLNDTFSAQTKLLVDLRPGTVFVDMHTSEAQYIYEATIVPFDVGPLTDLIFRAAQQPLEDLDDQGYVTFREKVINGARYTMSLKDFIKCVAIQRFKVTAFNINDEQELTKNMKF